MYLRFLLLNFVLFIMYFFVLVKINKIFQSSLGSKMSSGDMCLLDSATTHMILREKKYFSHLVMKKAYVNTISSSTNLIEGSGRAALLLPWGTLLVIDNALNCSKSHRNLLSFKVIRQDGYHVEFANEGKMEYLYLTTINADKKLCMKIARTFFWVVPYKYWYSWITCHSKQKFYWF